MNREQFINTLGRLVSLGKSLQNSACVGKIPKERLAAAVVLERLRQPIESGALKAELIASPDAPDRTNLWLTLPGDTEETLGFVGAHFDVVPADRDAERWTSDPFQLVVDADGTLRGRGVTDCLGHVAVLTELLADLVERGVKPRRTIHVLMIANEEESSIPGIGLDYVASLGRLEVLAKGPLFWLDSADFGPTLGTGGIAAWELVADGVPGHSGMPQHCVNALELAMACTLELTQWFERTYPPHPDEARWRYASSSSLKATMVECENHKVTMIPAQARIKGDIRLTPFYDLDAAVAGAKAFVEQVEAQLQSVEPGGRWAKYRTAAGQSGSVRLYPPAHHMAGVACRLDSPGLLALERAIRRVRGQAGLAPASMTGSLPLVRDLQRRGFDVQITGFGRQVAYHAPNEHAHINDFEDGFSILCDLIETL